MHITKFESPSKTNTEQDLQSFLEQFDASLAEISNVQNHLTWSQVNGLEYDAGLQARIDDARDNLFTARNHETIRIWRDTANDPILRRWTEVLDNQFVMTRVEQDPELRACVNHIADRYLHWRPTINGRESSYTEHTWITRLEPDRELRRAAYLAFWDLGDELLGATRQMFHLRNDAARELGYATYADLKLELVDGVDRDWLIGHFGEMDAVTAEYILELSGATG